ncbi:hypothetical protein Ahy_A06g028925 [Arachis hypogaea]|uniref:Uncharacterized protein n=1 Tax=Arachis hypogaea TaxID=3818 RepID=A0A445CRX4_ARAHY|nr:hypothetical protein Ahy_A06g028925 [Arachis hypogaea]
MEFIWDAKYNLMIKKIYDHWGRDHLTRWICQSVKKELEAHFRYDEGFKHRRLMNVANRVLPKLSKYTDGSSTFIKMKSRLSKSLDREATLAETFKYTHTSKANKERFVDERSTSHYYPNRNRWVTFYHGKDYLAYQVHGLSLIEYVPDRVATPYSYLSCSHQDSRDQKTMINLHSIKLQCRIVAWNLRASAKRWWWWQDKLTDSISSSLSFSEPVSRQCSSVCESSENLAFGSTNDASLGTLIFVPLPWLGLGIELDMPEHENEELRPRFTTSM